MEQNAQNAAFYPHAFPPPVHPAHHAFNPLLQRSEDPPSFLPSSYYTPSAPSAAPQGMYEQGFHATESVQGLEYGKHHEARETCNTGATSDSQTKMNVDDLYQAFKDVSKRVSQLESTIEGLKCAEREKHMENNDRLARLELLIKEVLQGVQHFNECQKLDGTTSQMRKLKVADDKALADEEKSMGRGWHPDKSHAHVEPGDLSEQMTQRFPGRLLRLHYPEAPPDPQNHSASYNTLPPQPRMNEPRKPAPEHPVPSHLHAHAAGPRDSMPPPLPSPHHSMQVPPFPNQAQVQPLFSPPPPTPMLPPPPPGFLNPSTEGSSYGLVQGQPQYMEPPVPPSSSYPEFPQYYTKIRQEVPHSSPQNGSSGAHVYEAASGVVKPTSGFVSPSMQLWQPESSSPPLSTFESINGPGYSPHPPHRASHPVISATSGGESHSRFANAQSLYSASSGSNGIPVDAVSAGRNQIIEVTDAVTAMGFPRQQVRAVVQGLTDMGHLVDRYAVLDKLMNRGESSESQRGWYG